MTAPWWVWLVGLSILAATVYTFISRARKGIATAGEFRGFTRNARLLLFQSPFSGFTVSLIQLLFNLYLLALGFDVLFVASYVWRNWLFPVSRSSPLESWRICSVVGGFISSPIAATS
jgi:hypothetical protein